MNRNDGVKINLIDTVHLNNKLGGLQIDEDEKKSDELQRLLLDTIPTLIRGIELVEDEIETISSADLLVEKRLLCQVLIDVSKILRDYPRGMGFKCKIVPQNLHGKPKLIAFRNNMDQLGWEIISKLSILREFIEVTSDIQKLYVVALGIRDAKNAFGTNKCDHYLKSTESSSTTGDGALSPRRNRNVPVVMSRAPRQVLESTRELVDNAITRKTLSKEDRANVFREMMSDRAFQMKEDPKRYGLNLLQQRRSRMLNHSGEDDSSINNNTNNNNNVRQQHSNSIDIGYAAFFQPPPPSSKEFSPPRSPPTSPEMMSKSPTSKKYIDLITSPRTSDRILKHYKLLSSSPSSSASNITAAYQVQQSTPQQLQQQLQMAADRQDIEWEKFDESRPPCLATTVRGFKVDCGHVNQKELGSLANYPVLYDEDDEFLYRDDFADKEHFNYLGYTKGGGEKNIVSISSVALPLASGDVELLYIIRSPDRDERVRIVTSNKRDSRDMIKMIKKSRTQLSNYKFKEIKEKSFTNDLLDFEKKNTVHRNFKFGVLLVRDGQTEENQMYANHEPNLSPEYRAFVDLLGERIELKGWPHYRGGLDIRDNMTGVHAMYKRWREYEIMFHVATMIPYKEEDEQQIDRKRHLGNDIVMIVFKEGSNSTFDPSICKSNFNHIFFIVQPIESSQGQLYKVEVSCRDEVVDFGPTFPKNHQFTAMELKEFLITKLVNGERSALKSPVFSQKFKRTRREFLQSFLDNYCPQN